MKLSAITYPSFVDKIPGLVRICHYVRTGFLLHVITLASIFFSYIFYHLTLWSLKSGHPYSSLLYAFLFIWISSLPLFAQMDARSRYQNYKLLKDLLYRYGFNYKLARALRHSRCQRDAAIVAANELGYKPVIDKYYSRCGYLWYHVLPDFIFKRPLYLFTKNFWMTTFFARTYHSKYFND